MKVVKLYVFTTFYVFLKQSNRRKLNFNSCLSINCPKFLINNVLRIKISRVKYAMKITGNF